MITALFLNDDELADLTGYRKPACQIEWLSKQGFSFRVAANGRPRVDRTHYLKLMGGVVDAAARKKTEPNFTGLRAVGGKA